ncbi:hypothetical protein [Nocardia sp. NPDC052566]|uniref:hypothetical protein n=1 Tax=Nocardia sp. NPDC052566 TaxID=3364330 RepID=UPI0037CC6A1C
MRANPVGYGFWLVVFGALIAWGVVGLLDSDVLCQKWSLTDFRSYYLEPGERCAPTSAQPWSGRSYRSTARANDVTDWVKIAAGAVPLALLVWAVADKARARGDEPAGD